MAEGMRYNEGKPKLSMIFEAPEALEGVARVLEYGANKYSRANWRDGFNVNDVMDSLMRHQLLFISGEDIDTESGLLHVDHIATNALFLAVMARRAERDDRALKDGHEDTLS